MLSLKKYYYNEHTAAKDQHTKQDWDFFKINNDFKELMLAHVGKQVKCALGARGGAPVLPP